MATESPIRMLDGKDKWPPSKPDRYAAIEDLGLFYKGQSFQSLDIDVIPSRSGSAPPSMEGSISAIESIFSKRKSTLNPGFVDPNNSIINRSSLQFRADATRARGTSVTSGQYFEGSLSSPESSDILAPNGSTISNQQAVSQLECTDGSVQLLKNRLSVKEEEAERDLSYGHVVSVEETTIVDYNSGPSDAVQGDSHHAMSLSCDQNLPMSHKSMEEAILADSESHVQHTYPTSTSTACVNSSSSDASSLVSSYDDTKGIVVEPSQNERDLNAARVELLHNLSIVPPEAPKFVNMSSSSNLDFKNNVLQQQASPEEGHSIVVQPSYPQFVYPGVSHGYGSSNQFHYVSSNASTSTVQPVLHSPGFASPLYAAPNLLTPSSLFYPNMHPAGFFPTQYGMGGYTFNPPVLPTYMAGYIPNGAVPVVFNGAAFTTPGVSSGGNVHTRDMQNIQKFYGQRIPLRHGTDPFHLQYIKPGAPASYGHQTSRHDPKKETEHVVSSNNHRHSHFSPAAYNNSNLRKGNESNHYSFPGGGSPGASVVSPNWRCNMNHSHLPSGSCKSHGLHNRCSNDTNLYSLLEELKTGKGQRFELSDVSGYIGELSVDQHGSRFIQQRLETCRVDEKVSVFREVIPYASNLMTDVFGNYVIQKLFDYGSPEQRRDLAEQLKGQILPLSLQMYGCRVIQKALEVIDLEQKARLVKELDGHVTRCVRDQNGNHVIQKCIESIPSDRVHFIISSFRGQVATLSMHPYGCRVIQRVLEHCKDESQTQFIVDEIVDSVSSLAQDQYGNYVTQHVLERSKPRERRTIIDRLCKSIVQLSQHKFASNVVEKCVEYSDSTARDKLIKEIVGRGDKHENLWIMMKDQYANYVIQKIIQKSTSDQRRMLLGLIRNHLTALKKYTYGKHIATRFEELYGAEIQTGDS